MKKKFYAVSNAHLDTQWNWTVQDTIREYIRNTLEDNFRNFRQAPKYLFNFEGAFKYKLMQEYYPEHYKKLKEYVSEGRWYPSGAFWDSCDVNVPSSEALMRQALLGNKFFEKEFGIFTKDVFLPDCFGFRSSLPSIARHMGLLGFSTQKLTWGVGCPIVHEDKSVSRPEFGEHTRMDLGKWKGPDEEEIYVSLNGGAYVYQFPEEDTPVEKREGILKAIEHNEKIAGVPWRAMYFGVGDKGGACSVKCAQMASDAEEAKDGLYEVKNAYTYEIFEDLDREKADLPTYKGHLLIPHGFGALTSHTISKRLNRSCEYLADSAERASVLASLYTDKPYPKERLNEAWKTFLWHQFHDDLTGTSICSAYVFSHNDYVIALNMFAAELSASVEAVAALLNTDTEGVPVLLYNPCGGRRKGTVKAAIDLDADYVRVYDEENREVPSQLSVVDGKKTVIFSAEVGAVGMTVYSVRKADAPAASELKVTDRTLENRFYRVTLDDNGDIASVYDKELARELLSAPVCLEISPDNSMVWPSWELCFEDNAKEHAFVRENVKIEIAEDGAAEAALRVTRNYGPSEFVQTISLSACEKLVSVENYVNWNSRNSLLKATFPLTASNPTAEFDLGLGADKGENTTSYPYFQHCVHTWADLTDAGGDFGVSILNDCKYGMDKPNDNTLRLTLIHTPVAPFGEPDSHQDWQDFGRNEFRFAITSHGKTRDGVAKTAEEFNRPILPFETEKHPGRYSSLSLVESTNDEVLIRAVKAEETGDRVIVRVQETSGRDQTASLRFGCDLVGSAETDGYERDIAPIEAKDNCLTFPIGHFAPKTFALTLKADRTARTGKFTSLALPYNAKLTSSNNIFDADSGIALPAEYFEKTIVSSAVPFTLGDKEANNALRAKGQTLTLPEGTETLYLLAAADGTEKKEFTFTADGQEISLAVSGLLGLVGSWDMIAKGTCCYINRDEIAGLFTHTHDKSGDRIYEFAYLFKYALPVNGARTLTLPDDRSLLIFAATASDHKEATRPAMPLYPVAEKENKPVYTLTVEGGENLVLAEGDLALVTAQDDDPEALFTGWEGDAIVTVDDTTALIRMPGQDSTIKILKRPLGKNLSYKKPAEASVSENSAETPDHAVNGISDEKWCALLDEEKGAWMSVDLGKVCTVSRWLVKHCGRLEGRGWNTCDFALEYKLSPEDEWRTADSVTGNTENVTLRDISPIQARFVRLVVTKAAQGGEMHARIYEFSVFEV